MKQSLRSLAKSSLAIFITLLVAGSGSLFIQYHPVNADPVNTSLYDQLCGSEPLETTTAVYNCGLDSNGPAPTYSNIEVTLFTLAATVLVLFAALFARRKYFARFHRKSDRPLLYAGVLGVILLLAAIPALGCITSIYNTNSVSQLSAEMLILLAFVPSLAVLVICLAKVRQNNQRKIMIALLLLITAAVCLAFSSILHVAGLQPN